ncbi:TonB-dependent receptor [Aliiglaciecola sp. 2_MG-2023]|uniref:TonB-dependent receptor n=1 Tax=unclassified Aliiglaciecola TaxID=2593648 RepID=UPI0026E37F53|nr:MULTISPECIES: TonB-dependent receptor [unclassified Aliiglaciecola]MDO6712927.1 TonB-dependent receptor [Aliiglaciecola sp. 2_MG-2023]MDO6753966.1 TonB-dependent receptor [Aliiglaciecola sp. 1_MG-2023]
MNTHFNKTSLAIAVALLCTNVHAQDSIDNTTDETEVITVTSAQASLIKALDLKRSSDSIVDGITAKELGIFPDANVADSLSHITGVTIDRTSGGEGKGVNIRGLGPEFSIVTINGRIMATDQSGREFAFDVLPSEVISEAWVHKSVKASTLEGSIGGAIDLRTARPFDNKGLQGSFSVEGNYGDKADKNGYKFTAVSSNTFADETMGFLFSALYSNTPTRTDSLSDLNYGVNWGWDHDNSDGGVVNWQDASNELIIPNVVAYTAQIEEKKRMAFSGAFQYQPSSKVDINADFLWTRLDAPSQGYTESYYLVGQASSWRDATFGGIATELNPEGTMVTGMTMDNLIPELVTITEHRVVDTYQVGLNGKFQVNDNFTVTGDVYLSNAKRDAGGKDKFVVAHGIGGVPNTATFSLTEGGLPNVIIDFADDAISSVGDLVNDSQFGPHYSQTNGVNIEDEVIGGSLIGELFLDMPIVSSIEFGAVYNKRSKDRVKIDNQHAQTLYSNAPFTFADTGVDVVQGFPIDDFLSDVSGDFPRQFVGFDIDAYQAALEASDNNPDVINRFTGEVYPDGYSDADEGRFNPNESFEVVEDTKSFFVQGNLFGEIAGMEWSGNAGLRYVNTDTTSNGWLWEIEKVSAPAAWVWVVEHYDPVAISVENSYSELLPSVNFAIELLDNLLLRLSYAEVMARASLNQLSTQVDDGSAAWGEFTLNRVGNPKLSPVKAKQSDVSIEWYFSEGSALTAAIFQKDIKGFVQDWQNVYPTEEDQANRPVYPVENPQPWIETGYVDTPFNVFEPKNLDTAKVLGYEFSLQHFFESGFGINANYTYIDTESYQDGTKIGVLAGIPDTSYSLNLMYNTDNLSLSLSGSHTESFILSHWSPLNLVSETPYKGTADPMTWVSASATYSFSSNLEAYVQLDNLLNDNWHSYNGTSSVPGSYSEWGRKVFVGVRYKL